MKARACLVGALRFLWETALVDLGIALAVGVVCWFGGHRTWAAFGNGLIWAGVGAMILGGASVFASWGTTRNAGYLLGQSASGHGMGEGARRALREVDASYGFMFRTIAIGIAPIIVGSIISGS